MLENSGNKNPYLKFDVEFFGQVSVESNLLTFFCII